MLRVLGCGGRDYTDYEKIRQALVDLGGKDAIEIVIHGGQRGADTLFGEAAAKLGIPWIPVYADWTLHGVKAGRLRNQRMLDEHHPNLCLAFPDPESKGTWDMVRRAKAAGVETKVMRLDGSGWY